MLQALMKEGNGARPALVPKNRAPKHRPQVGRDGMPNCQTAGNSKAVSYPRKRSTVLLCQGGGKCSGESWLDVNLLMV